MDYIGMFEFDEKEKDDVKHATFMLLVKANDVEDAVEKFKDAIRSLKKSHEALANAQKVYVSRIGQVRSFPETPLMTYWESGQTKSEGWSCIGYDGDGGSYFDSFGFGEDEAEECKPLVTFIGPEKEKMGGNGNAGRRRLILVTGGKKGGSDQ